MPDNVPSEDRVRILIADALRDHEGRMMAHFDDRFDQLTNTFSAAFPSGDPHAHRLNHEMEIRNAGGWDKLKADVISKFLTGGLWVAAGYLVLMVWESIKDSLKAP